MKRMQFEIPEEREQELMDLMRRTGITTRKDLFNNALTVFEWMVREREQGNSIASINEKEKKFKELVTPIRVNTVTH